MITLPKFFYVLQNTYYKIPQDTFIKIDSEVCSLKWNKGHPRIALKPLQRNPHNWGIALPDIMTYYWCAHLISIDD